MTGDGVPDLLVSAGFGGGPRVTFWDGDSVRRRSPVSVANFFAFEDSLRNGTTIAELDPPFRRALPVREGRDGLPES